MEAITFMIALVALVLAAIAFARTGGVGDLRRQLETLNGRTGTAREKVADALDRLEQSIRGKGRPLGPRPGPPAGCAPDERG